MPIMMRTSIVASLILALAGCGDTGRPTHSGTTDPQQVHSTKAISDHATTDAPTATPPNLEPGDLTAVSPRVERIVWNSLDAEIRSQARLASSVFCHPRADDEVAEELLLPLNERILIEEQLILSREIRRSKDVALARQYVVVRTLMAIEEAERRQRLLGPVSSSRHWQIHREIKRANERLAAIGYHKAQPGTKSGK